MSSRCQLTLGVAAVLIGSFSASPVFVQVARAQSSAALVSELTGSASIQSTTPKAVPVERFDAIAVDVVIEVGPESRVTLVLAGGKRFELGPGARATIAVDRLTSQSGPITQLTSLPPLPRIAALDASRPKGPPGGIRLRGPRISRLDPFDAVTLAPHTQLRFAPVAGAGTYDIEIEDYSGRRVFGFETRDSEVIVPSGVLEPGVAYQWTVRTLDLFGATARGTGQFRTLSSEDERDREALRRSLDAEGGARALALLAAVDQRLGLYAEALEGFREALRRTPDDMPIAKAIRSLEERLEDASPK
jgi:hypothetical protein